MKTRLIWNKKMNFQAETPSGHEIAFDASPEVGGENKGARPMETLLASVGACSGIDIVDILRKMRLEVETFHMEVQGERAQDHPRRFTRIEITYRLPGVLPVEKVKRAMALSVDTYCSVSQSLTAEIITHLVVNGNKVA